MTTISSVGIGSTSQTTVGALTIGSLTTGFTLVNVPQGGLGVATLTTAYGLLAAGTTATGAVQTLATGTTGQVLQSNGNAALPSFTSTLAAGVLANIPGRLINRRLLTSGTGATYTPTAGTTSILVELVGGGGGGGGINVQTTTGSVAGGGGAGSFVQKYITGITGGYTGTYTVGAGGAGGAAGTNDGASGTSTTYADGTYTLTGSGASGGVAGLDSTTAFAFQGSMGTSVASTGGDLNIKGGWGEPGFLNNLGTGIGGGGGMSYFGGAGDPVRTFSGASAAGFNASANSGGGGGGASGNGVNATRAGGNGANGVILIYEFS